MTVRDMVLAALVSAVWGFGFIAISVGLQSFSAPQLAAMRFLVAGLPVFLVPRPRISWISLISIGMTLFAGQFLLLFLAYTQGLPPGLASVTQQLQAFFTVLLAAVFLRDIPGLRQGIGMTVAFAGLILIALTVGADLKVTGLALALAAAMSWAVGNVLVKRATDVPVFPLVVWCSLVPPVPALIVSGLWGDGPWLPAAILRASWLGLAAVIYLGALATTLCYALWGYLLQRYPTATLAPFALLAPCVGIVSAALIFGEVFTPARYAGMALILAGLAIVVLPGYWAGTLRPRRN